MSRKMTRVGVEARRTAVVEAATEVFLRYGYARTTMAELAAAAALSRPTLYELFPGKDDLFAAVIDDLSQQTIRRYRDTLPNLKTLQKKLLYLCSDWATHGLKLTEQHPDAKDLFDLRFPAVRQMYEDFILFLVEVFWKETHLTQKVRLEKILRNLVFSLLGLLNTAKDVEHMETLIALQVGIFLPALTSAG